MNERIIGRVRRVVGPVVEATGVTGVEMLELVFVGNERLVGEVVRIRDDAAWIQVYEDTTGLRPASPIFGQGEPLSVELGPGLIGSIYDGVQRPLDVLKTQMGDFISKGLHVPALDRSRRWAFTPKRTAPCPVRGSMVLGTVKESEVVEHRIMVPPNVSGELVEIVSGTVNLAPKDQRRVANFNIRVKLVRASEAEKAKQAASAAQPASKAK